MTRRPATRSTRLRSPPTERRSTGASVGSGPLLLAPWGPGDTGSDSAAPTGAGHPGQHPGSRGRSREIGAGAGQPCSAAPAGTEAQRAGCPGPAGLSSLSAGAAASHRPEPPPSPAATLSPPPAPGRLPQSRGAPAAGCPRPSRCPALPGGRPPAARSLTHPRARPRIPLPRPTAGSEEEELGRVLRLSPPPPRVLLSSPFKSSCTSRSRLPALTQGPGGARRAGGRPAPRDGSAPGSTKPSERKEGAGVASV